MNRKPSRGITGYVILLATLLLVAILLNGGLNQTVNRRIEYPELLTKIKAGTVGRVAIRNNSLVGVYTNTLVPADDFPEKGYDFETTIGEDFVETARQIEANNQGVSVHLGLLYASGVSSISDLFFIIASSTSLLKSP